MGSRIYCIKAFSFFIVYHFTVACLLSRNCLLSQQLPHISVSNVLLIFVVFSFFFFCFCFFFFSHFVMAKEQNSFLWNQLFRNICHIVILSHSPNKCVTMVSQVICRFTILIKLTDRISSMWDYYDLSRPPLFMKTRRLFTRQEMTEN